LAPSHAARAAPPRDADGDPQKIEQLPGQLNFKNSLDDALRQVKTFAALFASIDPAALVALAFLILEGAR
jgi:hypothetical protein